MSYIVGLDLGQISDPTAVAILEVSSRQRPGNPDARDNLYACSHLQRYRLGTPYTEIVRVVTELVATPPLPGCVLVVDETGVGRPVVDLFRQARPQCTIRPITITGGVGAATSKPGGGYHVGKRELVSTLQALLGTRRLRVAQTPEAATLIKELQNFKIKITSGAHESFGAWRENAHDDLVLALALAAWFGEHVPVGWDGRLGLGMSEVSKAPRGVFLES